MGDTPVVVVGKGVQKDHSPVAGVSTAGAWRALPGSDGAHTRRGSWLQFSLMAGAGWLTPAPASAAAVGEAMLRPRRKLLRVLAPLLTKHCPMSTRGFLGNPDACH